MSNASTIQNPRNLTKSRNLTTKGYPQSPSSSGVDLKPAVPAPAVSRAPNPAASAHKEITFRLEAHAAREVLLAGDFTNWEKTPIKLRKGDRGAWQATLKLAPGQYHYRFLVDGHWQNDPAASGTCPNPYGSCDCVVKIP
jgi:hypothetical protein